jgi:hypothetical protein
MTLPNLTQHKPKNFIIFFTNIYFFRYSYLLHELLGRDSIIFVGILEKKFENQVLLGYHVCKHYIQADYPTFFSLRSEADSQKRSWYVALSSSLGQAELELGWSVIEAFFYILRKRASLVQALKVQELFLSSRPLECPASCSEKDTVK